MYVFTGLIKRVVTRHSIINCVKLSGGKIALILRI